MITEIDLKQAVQRQLTAAFNIPCYGMDMKEGLKKPAFFVQMVVATTETVNIQTMAAEFFINYLQKKTDEKDALNAAIKIRQLFIPKIKVKHRKLTVENYAYSYIGKNGDLMRISFDINFMQQKPKPLTKPIREVKIRMEE